MQVKQPTRVIRNLTRWIRFSSLTQFLQRQISGVSTQGSEKSKPVAEKQVDGAALRRGYGFRPLEWRHCTPKAEKPARKQHPEIRASRATIGSDLILFKGHDLDSPKPYLSRS
jgi:hypothetical protein